MLSLLILYYKETLKFNIPFSLLIGILGIALGFIQAFSFSLLTGGFLISLYFYNLRRKEEYFFYYNRGLTNLHLWAGSFVLNAVLVILLNIISNFY